MFVGEQVMEQLCPGLVLVQYPGFVFLDDEIGPCHSLGDFRRFVDVALRGSACRL